MYHGERLWHSCAPHASISAPKVKSASPMKPIKSSLRFHIVRPGLGKCTCFLIRLNPTWTLLLIILLQAKAAYVCQILAFSTSISFHRGCLWSAILTPSLVAGSVKDVELGKTHISPAAQTAT